MWLMWTYYPLNLGKSSDTNYFTTKIYTPDETSVVDLSKVVDKPTYVIITSYRLILAENLNLFVS